MADRQGRYPGGGGASARHAGPGRRGGEKVDFDRPGLRGPDRVHPRHHPAGQGVGLSDRAARPRRKRRQGRRPALQARPPRFPGGGRPSQRPDRAGQRLARLPALQFQPGRCAFEERLSGQGLLRPARQHHAASRGRHHDSPGFGARRPAQPRLHRDPRPISRAARPQPGPRGHPRQHGRHRAQHPGAARSGLRHLQPERDRSSRDREGTPGRHGGGGCRRSRRNGAQPQGRAHLRGQRRRPLDRHRHGAGDDRQRRQAPAARAVCPHPGARARAAQHPAGAADRHRVEPARQICVRDRRWRHGRAADGVARPHPGRAGRHSKRRG